MKILKLLSKSTLAPDVHFTYLIDHSKKEEQENEIKNKKGD